MASGRKLILIAGGACAERIAIIGKGQVLAQDTRQRKMTLETPRLGLQSGVGHNLRLQWTIAEWRLLNNLKTFCIRCIIELAASAAAAAGLKTSVKAETEAAQRS